MSVRRHVGDVVLLTDDDGTKYKARIVAHGRGTEPDECVRRCGDPACGEWPVVEVVDDDHKPTGERVFHVCECEMLPL